MSTSCSCKKNSCSAPTIVAVDSIWRFRDYFGAILVRFSNWFRMGYRINPGLYSIGSVDSSSPVFVTANYKLSFDLVRKALVGMSAYILVLDTKGINVWCAAGKKTFGTQELLREIKDTSLNTVVSHKKVIVPQLGAPGLNAQQIVKECGFRVVFGPVSARDIPSFVSSGYKKTKAMSTVQFGIVDRMILIPIEVRHALKVILPAALITGLLLCINSHGFTTGSLLTTWKPFLYACGLSLLGGTIISPLLLPWIPFRSFCLKGLIAGLLCMIPLLFSTDVSIIQKLFFLFSVPALSSFFAFNFTGSTTFTNPSGVKKELTIGLPYFISAIAVSCILFIIYKVQTWGIQ